jgi:uncharacterized protein with GYD domain
MSCLLSIGSQGNARTVTLKAFTYGDASKIMDQNTDCFKIALFALNIKK